MIIITARELPGFDSKSSPGILNVLGDGDSDGGGFRTNTPIISFPRNRLETWARAIARASL